MESSRVWICSKIILVAVALLLLLNVASSSATAAAADEEATQVLTLDRSNFSEIVSKHYFMVVEFYAPWCGHCKTLAPEYEKAASVLSSHDPPIVLAKVDANEEANRDLATEFQIQGFPTIKILKNGGKIIQDYKGPREADGIVDYLKKQVGPPSVEIKSTADASSLIDEKKIFVVGLFPEFSGKQFENFMTLAEKLRSDYDFAHTLDAKLLPRGEPVDKPTLRMIKPFDKLFVDFQDFEVDAMEKFIGEESLPIVTIWDNDPTNHIYINKYLESPTNKAMLFVNFSTEHDSFQVMYREVAAQYKGKGISFLLGDTAAAEGAFQFFGLEKQQAPLLIILKANEQKYLKAKIEPSQIGPWVKDYLDGQVKPFVRSEPIPEVNNEPVKVVVADSFQEMVFDSGKNVLLEFYAPWCGHCKQLAPILDEVAVYFENESDVLIAKFDATANDVSRHIFDVQGYPTVYFRSASGNLSQYDGDRTKEDIIDFIQKNRDKPAQSSSTEPESTESESANTDFANDEL